MTDREATVTRPARSHDLVLPWPGQALAWLMRAGRGRFGSRAGARPFAVSLVDPVRISGFESTFLMEAYT
jgi:hypothetical protein